MTNAPGPKTEGAALNMPGKPVQNSAADPRNEAHAYAEHGWPVFPLRGKLPARPKSTGGRGFHDATTDHEVIDRMWRPYPGANVGIRTGEQSGLAVLDIDPRHGGSAALSRIEQENGCLPGTLMQLTGSDGLHMLYAWQAGLGCGTNLWGPGLDLRGEGGYIVAAPSIHPDTGRAYAWHGDEWTHELPAWPIRQLPLERPQVAKSANVLPFPRQSGSGALRGLVQVVLAAQPGERNGKLNWAAYRAGEHVAAGRLYLDEVHADLLAAALQIGLSEREALTTLASGLRSAGAT
jgi:hypothetical protein